MTRQVILSILFALTASAAGQLQLFLAPENKPEVPVGNSVQLSDTPMIDKLDTRFRIRNTGDASVTLTALRVAGVGFSMSGQPALPYIVAPGTNVDFTVTFRPPDWGSYSANLLVNATGYLLQARGSPAIGVYYKGEPVLSGATIDFGAVERGNDLRAAFEYRNTLKEPMGITQATVSGAPFSFPSGPPTPWLEPGQSVGFDVAFRPTQAGVFTANLTIDRRVFHLVGTCTEPPIPRPTLVIDTPAIRSGQQGRLSIHLAEASRGRAEGRITMELRPVGEIRDNDASAQFVSGERSTSFRIVEDQSTVEGIWFQAGTTAGTIVFTVEVGGYTDRASVVVAPEVVKIDRSAAARNGSAVEVQLTGFDNTRTASDMAFTFYSTSGQPLPGMPLKLSLARDFERWWQDSKLGGVFQFRASFPVTGDITQIGGVEASVVNASGTTQTQRMSF